MKTILISDLPGARRAFCQAALRDEDYKVVVADEVSRAIQLASSLHPDLVILPTSTQQVEGTDAAEWLNWLWPELPVLVLTAQDLGDSAESKEQLKRTVVDAIATSAHPEYHHVH